MTITENERKIFDAVVRAGWYADYVRAPGARSKPKRWEVTALAGILRGKGADQQKALDEAWECFLRCER